MPIRAQGNLRIRTRPVQSGTLSREIENNIRADKQAIRQLKILTPTGKEEPSNRMLTQALSGNRSLAKRRPNVLFKLINSMETLRPPSTRTQTTIDHESMSGYPA